jgi:hypothetical protein
MKKVLPIAILFVVAPIVAHDDVVESRTLERTLELADRSGRSSLVVDNIFGSITVAGHARPVIEMVAKETVRARSRDALDRARAEVALDVRQDGNDVVFFVDGPFRDRRRDGNWDSRYSVTYEFEIKVPYDTDFDLKTVNDGEIRVSEVRGRFDVANVNGGVELTDIAGSGDATTVNGPVRIRFHENPGGDSNFRTINGTLDLAFQPSLSADLHFKTFNGEVWTDFPAEPLPLRPALEESRDGKWVIRSHDWSGVRIDNGGPQLSFETLNGDILIRSAAR